VGSCKVCIQIWKIGKKRYRSTNCNATAFAAGSIESDAPYTGVKFDLASCSSGFSQMLLGLSHSPVSGSSSRDVTGSVDFGVRLDGDELFLNTLQVEEFGKKTGCISCEGNESITIRLDAEGAHVEFLVNNELVYVSKRPPRFPLGFKAVSKVTRNINVRTYLGLGHFCMRLPVKDLMWSKAVFKVLTLHVVDVGNDGLVHTTCTNLAGDELARMETQVGRSIADFKEALVQQIQSSFNELILVSGDGNVILDTDSWLRLT